jgi:hypothetical protein
MDNALNSKIKLVNDCLRTKESKKINSKALRTILSAKIGDFITARKNIFDSKYSQEGIMGVDGSINQIGATFPYLLTLIRAYAMCTIADSEGNTDKIEEVFCHVLEADRSVLENIVDSAEGYMTMENAFSKYTKDRMAKLELMSAINGIKRYKPKNVFMDGGFYRYEITCPSLWAEFKKLCLETDTLVVGVIEEVSTHKLSSLLEKDLPLHMSRDYDRELLFGVLEIGEWLKVKSDIEIKDGYYTAFARFSKHPQVIGIDFLKEQIASVDSTMELIASLTPLDSRGIPLWIDIVDKNVRITHQETEVLMGSMDRDIREKFVIANHDRRQ